MTDDTMNLQALVENGANADFLREMIGFAAQWLMNQQVGRLMAAGYGLRLRIKTAPQDIKA